MIRDMWQRLTSWIGHARRPGSFNRVKLPTAIAFDAKGFSVTSAEAGFPSVLQVRWAEVQKVVVFKRDIFAYDVICFVAELPGPQAIELNEEMEGWQHFVETLPEYLPGIRPWHKWLMDVAFPPFETKPTLIYSRQADASRTGPAEHHSSGQ